MARLAIPIIGKTLYATGDTKLYAEVILSIRDGAGQFVDYSFLIDTGTEIATFPAQEAKNIGLVVPARPASVKHEQTGLEVRSGLLTFRIGGLGPTLIAAPCLFLGDPNGPPPTGSSAKPRMLLQPFALLNVLKFAIDKDPLAIGATHGEWIVETR